MMAKLSKVFLFPLITLNYFFRDTTDTCVCVCECVCVFVCD